MHPCIHHAVVVVFFQEEVFCHHTVLSLLCRHGIARQDLGEIGKGHNEVVVLCLAFFPELGIQQISSWVFHILHGSHIGFLGGSPSESVEEEVEQDASQDLPSWWLHWHLFTVMGPSLHSTCTGRAQSASASWLGFLICTFHQGLHLIPMWFFATRKCFMAFWLLLLCGGYQGPGWSQSVVGEWWPHHWLQQGGWEPGRSSSANLYIICFSAASLMCLWCISSLLSSIQSCYLWVTGPRWCSHGQDLKFVLAHNEAMISLAVCTTHGLCHDHILSVSLLGVDMIRCQCLECGCIRDTLWLWLGKWKNVGGDDKVMHSTHLKEQTIADALTLSSNDPFSGLIICPIIWH